MRKKISIAAAQAKVDQTQKSGQNVCVGCFGPTSTMAASMGSLAWNIAFDHHLTGSPEAVSMGAAKAAGAEMEDGSTWRHALCLRCADARNIKVGIIGASECPTYVEPGYEPAHHAN